MMNREEILLYLTDHKESNLCCQWILFNVNFPFYILIVVNIIYLSFWITNKAYCTEALELCKNILHKED